MKIRIKKLHPDAVKPTYAKPGDACFDLRSIADDVLVPSGGVVAVRTGIAIEVPEGYALLLHSRSGHGKVKVSLANSTGIIDSGYRGELVLLISNGGVSWFKVSKGDRIAQGMIVPIITADLEWADELSNTERGEGGFGSSGVK